MPRNLREPSRGGCRIPQPGTATHTRTFKCTVYPVIALSPALPPALVPASSLLLVSPTFPQQSWMIQDCGFGFPPATSRVRFPRSKVPCAFCGPLPSLSSSLPGASFGSLPSFVYGSFWANCLFGFVRDSHGMYAFSPHLTPHTTCTDHLNCSS